MSCLHKREKGKLDKASTLSGEEKKYNVWYLYEKAGGQPTRVRIIYIIKFVMHMLYLCCF